jgi:hypothetical protein
LSLEDFLENLDLSNLEKDGFFSDCAEDEIAEKKGSPSSDIISKSQTAIKTPQKLTSTIDIGASKESSPLLKRSAQRKRKMTSQYIFQEASISEDLHSSVLCGQKRQRSRNTSLVPNSSQGNPSEAAQASE